MVTANSQPVVRHCTIKAFWGLPQRSESGGDSGTLQVNVLSVQTSQNNSHGQGHCCREQYPHKQCQHGIQIAYSSPVAVAEGGIALFSASSVASIILHPTWQRIQQQQGLFHAPSSDSLSHAFVVVVAVDDNNNDRALPNPTTLRWMTPLQRTLHPCKQGQPIRRQRQ